MEKNWQITNSKDITKKILRAECRNFDNLAILIYHTFNKLYDNILILMDALQVHKWLSINCKYTGSQLCIEYIFIYYLLTITDS